MRKHASTLRRQDDGKFRIKHSHNIDIDVTFMLHLTVLVRAV
jgi:hypothetical protein